MIGSQEKFSDKRLVYPLKVTNTNKRINDKCLVVHQFKMLNTFKSFDVVLVLALSFLIIVTKHAVLQEKVDVPSFYASSY